jgi:hypothetical protein
VRRKDRWLMQPLGLPTRYCGHGHPDAVHVHHVKLAHEAGNPRRLQPAWNDLHSCESQHLTGPPLGVLLEVGSIVARYGWPQAGVGLSHREPGYNSRHATILARQGVNHMENSH